MAGCYHFSTFYKGNKMKWILLGLVLASSAFAENSKIIPVFMEAAHHYVEGQSLYVRPDVRAALKVLEESKIDPELLAPFAEMKSREFPLRSDDKYDQWMSNSSADLTEVPEMAVQAARLTVIDQSDWLGDDMYAYFFITDGVIPTGKVTSIYKGTISGQSFFFNEIDRAIFPLIGVPAKRPENHLIIDFGLIESDGDDIKNMQKLSSIIIDLAIAVYTSYDPQNAQVIINLRKEIKALAEMLISLNHDDRLVTGTLAWKTSELEEILKNETFVTIPQKFKGTTPVGTYEYKIDFRLLKK